jgi:diguanylate cyclase (GGDEF)-like protein
MYIDTFTVLLFGLLVKLPLSILFLIFWLGGRRASGFAWWGVALLLGAIAGAIFMTRGFAGEFFTIGIGVASLIAAFDCCWQGARAFEGRPALRWPLIMPLIWLVLSLVPEFTASVSYRVVMSSLLTAPFAAMTAFEFWRGRAESLPSRWGVVLLFASVAIFFAARIPLVDIAPFPFGALPTKGISVAAFNLFLIFHTVLITVLLVAMSRERLELEQREKAQTDPLTGALNRLAFMTRGVRIVLRHQTRAQALCVLFIDIDHFKSLNDRYGHSGGDDVLVKFVEHVQDLIRPTDFLFRIGGEEFCCLLPNTHTDDACSVAERIRSRIEAVPIDVAGTQVNVTVSIGVASTETFGHDVDTLLRRADKAVYSAKREGRNLVMLAVADGTKAADAVVAGSAMLAAE